MGTFIKVLAILGGGSVAALILLAVVGHILDTQDLLRNREAAATFMKLAAFALFLVIGFTLVPLAMHVFLVAQGAIGNADVGMVRFLREHERGVTFFMWGMFTTGLLLALPVMWTDFFGFKLPLGRSQGTVVANLGMTLADAAARSTAQLGPASHESLTGSSRSVGRGLFDFEVAGTRLRFENCRYYWLETGSHENPNINHINVGISPRKVPRAQLPAERERLIGRLRAAGWSAGHFEYTDPEKITLHGGTRDGDGRYFATGETLLIVNENRVDEQKAGEDQETAGEYILYIDLVPRRDGNYTTLVFEPNLAGTHASKF
jgi:hypothetical protein